MRFRIGYGGPKEYRHGRYFPGGRVNNGGMTEIERLIHLIASMQILFGSRRGIWVFPILIVLGICLVGGWYGYQVMYSPESALERAHALYESSDTKEQLEGIKQYKVLLQKSDPLERGRFWLMTDRDTLYRRIIQHELLFAVDEPRAYEWAIKAWEEGLTTLRFNDPKVQSFWKESIVTRRTKGKSRSRTRQPQTARQSSKPENKTPAEKTSDKDGEFQAIPGIDN